VAIALLAGCGGRQHVETPAPTQPLPTAGLAAQQVSVLPLTLLAAEDSLHWQAKFADRRAALAQADSVIGTLLTARAPEVTWVLPEALRKAARRAPGIAPDPDQMGTALLRAPNIEIVPDPLRGELRTLVALAANGGRYALVPAALVYRRAGRGAAPPGRPTARPPARDSGADNRDGRRAHRAPGVPDHGARRRRRSLVGADGRREEPHAGAAVTREATLIAGDGIGPEITQATLQVLDGLGVRIEWDEEYGGMSAIEKAGTPLPNATLDSIRRTGLALKGPLTTPVGGGYRSVNVALRQEFELYANVRPVKSIVPGGRYQNVDLVIVRENTEGLYVGMDRTFKVGGDPKALAQATSVMTRDGCRRIVRYAFEYAKRHGRKKVTVVHKANILKATSGLFLETARQIAQEYEGQIASDDKIVDNAAMQLVINPAQFDVIVTTNLFGDILSDEASGLVGGLGLAPGANIGETAAIFEAVHGSAPDIAGQGIANPSAQLLAAAMMLDHIGELGAGDRLRRALETAIVKDNVRTKDLGGSASTTEFARAVVRRL